MTIHPLFPGRDDDDDPAPGEPAGEVPVEADDSPREPEFTSLDDIAGELRPIFPVWLSSLDELRAAVRLHTGRQAHATAYHGFRFPGYILMVLAWAIRGISVLTARLFRSWHCTDGWILESQAVAAGRAGHADAMRAHTEGKKTRGKRGRIIAVCVVIVLALILAGVIWLPWKAWAGIGAVVALVLAFHGKPPGRPLVAPAAVPPRYAPPTPAVITRALGS